MAQDQREAVTVEGIVSSMIFQNEENGYTILKLEVEQEEIIVVGNLLGVMPGEALTVYGQWICHPVYGDQFRGQRAERRLPQGQKEICHYLSSGAIRGIGKSTARRIVEHFGEDSLQVIEEEPEKLAQIQGISLRRARTIGETFQRQMGMRRLVECLSQHQLPMSLAIQLCRNYGDEALDALKANPYLLADSVYDLPFDRVDQLAQSFGFSPYAHQRLEAGLCYELKQSLQQGHSCLPQDRLILGTERRLGVEKCWIQERLQELIQQGSFTLQLWNGEPMIYFTWMYETEVQVAHRLGEMGQRELAPPEQLSQRLEEVQQKLGITYAKDQLQGVAQGVCQQLMLLTGGPGTGKTTCLRGILAILEDMGLEVALTAPTGRAAKRLGELCGTEASTIHRLLGTAFDAKCGKLNFLHHKNHLLPLDGLIVDEMSMVDLPLMAALLDGLPEDCRLILVGDPDQLPSVGPGNLLGDLLASRVIPTVRLTEIFRQAAESAIVRNAHLVNRGEMPPLRENHQDFFFLCRRSWERAVETIVDLCCRRLPSRMGILPEQIQVLSPTRRGETGTRALNQALQAALNPPEQGKGEYLFGEWSFRKGDRVMQVKNNYDILWKDQEGQSGMGVFNGDIGVIYEVERDLVQVDFEGRLVEYGPHMLSELEPAYAVTVHKAQGSEYRAVILATLEGAPMLMTRGVLYTAITRAKELFILVGDDWVVANMIHQNRRDKRYSGLEYRLKGGERQEEG